MNSSSATLSLWQQFLLVLLRFLIGWHLFFQGFGKIQAVAWSSQGYLEGARGPFAWLFHSIAGTPILVTIADVVTIWALIVLGLFLMLGLFSRYSALAGFLLLMLFYLAAPAVSAQGFIVESPQGAEFWVDKTLLEALALLLIASFETGRIAGLDILVRHWRAGRQPRTALGSVME